MNNCLKRRFAIESLRQEDFDYVTVPDKMKPGGTVIINFYNPPKKKKKLKIRCWNINCKFRQSFPICGHYELHSLDLIEEKIYDKI